MTATVQTLEGFIGLCSASNKAEDQPRAVVSQPKPAERAPMSWKERKLVRALKARDEEAFTIMVRTYQHKVFNITFRILGNRAEAEEVAQETFVAVFKHVGSFRGDAKFSTWVYRIATNQARNRIKHLSRRSHRDHQGLDTTPESSMAGSQFSASVATPDEQALGHELEEIIREGLSFLSEIHRTILVLRDIENLSYAEIAEIVDLPEGTVKSRLFRARVALKDYVQSRYAQD